MDAGTGLQESPCDVVGQYDVSVTIQQDDAEGRALEHGGDGAVGLGFGGHQFLAQPNGLANVGQERPNAV